MSMMPGVTNLPVPSNTVTSCGIGVSGPPTATILPPLMKTVPFAIIPPLPS